MRFAPAAGVGNAVIVTSFSVGAVSISHTVVASLIRPHKSTNALVISAVLFVSLALLATYVPPKIRSAQPRVGLLAIEMLWGALAFSLMVAVAFRAHAVAPYPTLFPIFVAAAAEELVFRLFLPTQLSHRLIHYGINRRTAWLAAAVTSQAAFALCHFVQRPVFGLPLQEFYRLFVAGLLYSEIVALLGVGSASAIHATANFSSETLSFPPPSLSLQAISFAALIGIVYLSRRLRSSQPGNVYQVVAGVEL